MTRETTYYRFLIFIFLLKSFNLTFADNSQLPMTPTPSSITVQESELKEVNFDKLNDILKKDKLDVYAKEKQKLAVKLSQEREKLESKRFSYPSDEDFWPLFHDYWLIKNARNLRWDFEKADLGIGISFKKTLEELSLNKKRIKILLLDSVILSHFALPTSENNYYFLLSLPFIRSMDLSKREISILLLEDMIRSDRQYALKNLKSENYKKFIGTQMKDKKPQVAFMDELLLDLNDLVFKRGFTFQQQFEVTKELDLLLSTSPELLKSYVVLNQKRDQLSKTDVNFKSYSTMYPSPEMQLLWLNPKGSNKKFMASPDAGLFAPRVKK